MSDTQRDSSAERTDHERDGDHDTIDTDTMKWVSALAAVVALWVIASPFIYESTDAAAWNNTLVGTAIFLLAGYNFVRLSRGELANAGAAALTLLLGLWIVVSPFIMGMGSDELATSTILSGIVIAILSAYNAYTNRKAEAPEHARTRA